MSSSVSALRRKRLAVSSMTAIAIWIGALMILLLSEPTMALLALASGAYAALLAGLTAWLIPKTDVPEPDTVLRASGTRRALALRIAVVVAAVVWTAAFGVERGGFKVPLLTPLLKSLQTVRLAPHLDGFVLHNFFSLALIPGILLIALGTRPRELGLCAPVRGTLKATLACLAYPLIMVIWAFTSKGLTIAGLFFWLLHNLLSNGFSEEFFARGMILSHLRARLKTDWALVLQALIFALLHAGGTIPEEHGNPARIIANVVGLNFPMGLALGFMAIRSRSLLLPTLVHISLDTMKDLLGMQ